MKKKKIVTLVLMFTCILCVSDFFGQGSVINEDLKLVANDGTMGDQFGHSIAIFNGVAAIGAPFDDDNGANSGSAYLFDVSTGEQIFKLLPTNGAANAEFGFSIAINNGIVAVGAKGDNEHGANAGAAYLFDVSTGDQIAKLTPNDPETGDEFGNSIAIDNGIVAVGAWRADEHGDASGAAYLFDASSGNQLDKLLPDAGNDFQTFGVSIAMSDGIVVIGARTFFVPSEGYTFAKAYLFDVSTGNQLNDLQPDILNYNGDLGGHFADCLDIDNGLIAVGTPFRSIFFDHSGAAYVFNTSDGSQVNFIFPKDGHDRDNFGISISIDNGIVALGAHQDDDNGFSSGSAYLYDAFTGTEISKLLASDGAILDLFGSSIAMEGSVIVVGAKDDDDNGENSGSAYVFTGITLDLFDNKLDEIYLYPNPSSNKVTIDIPANMDGSYEIRINNSIGQLIELIESTSLGGSSKVLLDVSAYENGLYFINIQVGDRSTVRKLLVN